MKLLDELASVLNKHSVESGSDTPDYLLAGYLKGCLDVFNQTVQQREIWHGRKRTDVEVGPMSQKDGE